MWAYIEVRERRSKLLQQKKLKIGHFNVREYNLNLERNQTCVIQNLFKSAIFIIFFIYIFITLLQFI